MQRIARKILYHSYLIFAWLGAKYVAMVVKPAQNKGDKKRILAVPYPPEGHNGGKERIEDWGPYIHKRGVDFEAHWTYQEAFYKKYGMSKNPFNQYYFYFKVTWDRIKLARKLKEYDAIWVQRAYIPIFPFKKGLFEKAIQKHGNVIYDFFDADYQSNYQLVIDTMTYANKITAASEFLEEYGKKINSNTHYIPFAFSYEKYPVKQYGNLDRITIGWMGSPGNFNYVKEIAPQLIQLENEVENVDFVFLCRDKADIGLKRLTYHAWGDDDFDYFKMIQKIDIGINPMHDFSDRTKAKVSFKCLEYMALGLAFATSQYGIPKGLNGCDNSVIVSEKDGWCDALKSLVEQKSLIPNLGKNARELMETDYDYEKSVDKLIGVFL